MGEGNNERRRRERELRPAGLLYLLFAICYSLFASSWLFDIVNRGTTMLAALIADGDDGARPAAHVAVRGTAEFAAGV